MLLPSSACAVSGNTHKHARLPSRVFIDFEHEVLRADVRHSSDLAASIKEPAEGSVDRLYAVE